MTVRKESYADYQKAKRQFEEADRAKREKAQDDFRSGKITILVANDAFGQGIDLPDIRLIIHYGVPKGLEFYLNQFGRGGRDGERCKVVLFFEPKDFNEHEANLCWDAKNGLVSGETHKRQMASLSRLREYSNQHTCHWRCIRQFYGEELGSDWVCGECSSCRRDSDKIEPADFGLPALVVLLLVEEATRGKPPNMGANKTELESLLGKKTGIAKSKADALRRQCSSVWSKPRINLFLNYMVDCGPQGIEEQLLSRECYRYQKAGQYPVRSASYKLMPAGRAALRKYHALGAQGVGEFRLMLPPPPFLIEWSEANPSKSTIHGNSTTGGESDDEFDDEDSDEEREDVLPAGQAYIEKAGGKRVYIPEKIVREELLKGKTRYLVRWREYVPHSKCLCVEGGKKRLEGCDACSWELADKPGPGNHRWRDSLVAEAWKAKRRAELSPEAAAEVEAREQEQMAKERAQAEAAESAAQAARAAKAAEVAAESTAMARAAQEVIDALPFAICFALQAAEGLEGIDVLRGDRLGLAYLKGLASAKSRDEINQLSKDYERPRVHLPDSRTGSALVYKVVMGLVTDEATGSAGWRIKAYRGPNCQSGQGASKLYREFGSANLIQLDLEDPKDVADEKLGGIPKEQAVQQRLSELEALLEQLTAAPMEICGRRFEYLLHKIEHRNDESKLMLVAVGASIEVAPPSLPPPLAPGAASPLAAAAPTLAIVHSPHWSSAGGTVYQGGWQTAAEARALLANFESLAPAKMAKRLGLALSPSMSLFGDFTFAWIAHDPSLGGGPPYKLTAPPEGVIQFVEWDEVYGKPGDPSSCVMTDGCGRMSMDLCLRIPMLENGLKMKENGPGSYDPEEQCGKGSAPFQLQGRIWVHGNVAKGMWFADPFLPERTVLVGREKQLKVKGEPGCVARLRGMPSFEVRGPSVAPPACRAPLPASRCLSYLSDLSCLCCLSESACVFPSPAGHPYVRAAQRGQAGPHQLVQPQPPRPGSRRRQPSQVPQAHTRLAGTQAAGARGSHGRRQVEVDGRHPPCAPLPKGGGAAEQRARRQGGRLQRAALCDDHGGAQPAHRALPPAPAQQDRRGLHQVAQEGQPGAARRERLRGLALPAPCRRGRPDRQP